MANTAPRSNRPLAGNAVTYKALGGPEVIKIIERTVLAPADGAVRIEVKAAASIRPTFFSAIQALGISLAVTLSPSCPAWMLQVSPNLSDRACCAASARR